MGYYTNSLSKNKEIRQSLMDLRDSPEKAWGSLLWSRSRCLYSEHSKLQPLAGRINACLTIHNSALNPGIPLHPSLRCRAISSRWNPIFSISLTILSKSDATSQAIGCPQVSNISRQNNANGSQKHSLGCSETLYSQNWASSRGKTGDFRDDSKDITKGRYLGTSLRPNGFQQQTPF